MSSSKPLGPGSTLRNPGVPFDLDWVLRTATDATRVERRAAELAAVGSVPQERETGLLLKAVACLDLTTLAPDDTPERISALCEEARSPLREDVLEALGVPPDTIRVAAVCVFDRFIPVAAAVLAGSGIPVAAVTAGFPVGPDPLPQRVAEVEAAVEAGAAEIDLVITRAHVLSGDWQALYDEVRALRGACGPSRLKTILATGELETLDNVAKASLVCMMAGADFVKTSTGSEKVNATLPVGLTMAGAIRAYGERTDHTVGLKPAGGIRHADDALRWLIMVEEELGPDWTHPRLFRIGASALLVDIERRLERHLPGP